MWPSNDCGDVADGDDPDCDEEDNLNDRNLPDCPTDLYARIGGNTMECTLYIQKQRRNEVITSLLSLFIVYNPPNEVPYHVVMKLQSITTTSLPLWHSGGRW